VGKSISCCYLLFNIRVSVLAFELAKYRACHCSSLYCIAHLLTVVDKPASCNVAASLQRCLWAFPCLRSVGALSVFQTGGLRRCFSVSVIVTRVRLVLPRTWFVPTVADKLRRYARSCLRSVCSPVRFSNRRSATLRRKHGVQAQRGRQAAHATQDKLLPS